MKPLFTFTSLRAQAVLWTLVPLTLIMLLVGSVSVYAYGRVVNRLVQDRDRELARVSAARLDENMENHAGVLRTLAERDELRSEKFASEQTITAPQRRLLLTALESGLLHKFDGGVILFDASGEAEFAAYSVLTNFDDRGNPIYEPAYVNLQPGSYAERPFFRIPRESLQTYYSDVVDSLGTPRIMISHPVLNRNGEFIGLLAGSFLLQHETLGDEIARLGVGTVYLVDRDGRVIWHADKQQLGADFSSQNSVRALSQPGASAMTDADETGETIVVGSARVETTGWGLVIQESWDTVIGPVRAFQWMMLGALVVGLALVVLIISAGTRRLTDTIQELVSQTQLLSQGDYVGHVQGGSINEMRSLSDAFNEMADRVASYRAGLQSYVAAITQSQEEERKRIARELHDDTIQSLIALGRRLELLEQSLENPIDAAKQLYQLQQMLSSTIAEVRQFSRDLRPLLLEDLGLEAALRQMLREMERRDGVQTELTISGALEPGTLDDELEVTLYRIAQEGLNNIRKHAEASHIAINLAFESNGVRLEVQDNGVGFPIAETADLAQRGSFGLMGIRERAKLFGGNFDVKSVLGEGSSVEVWLPLTVAPEWVLEELKSKQTPVLSPA